MTTKEKWLGYAEIFDAMRVVPRICVGFFWIYLGYVTIWYTGLENPSTQQTSFAATIAGTLVPFLGWYMSTGRMWSEMNRVLPRKKRKEEDDDLNRAS